MYELSTLLTVIVRTVAGWFGVRTAADELPLLFDGGAEVAPAKPGSPGLGFHMSAVDALAEGCLHRVGGDNGGPGFYI